MDIRLLDAEPTEAERDAVDAFLGPPVSRLGRCVDAVEKRAFGARPGHAARAGRHQLLPALHSLHERTGWISPGALNYIAARLTVPPADVYGVATFYALFSVRPRARRVLHVCNDLVCRCVGSESLFAALEEHVGPRGSERDGTTWLPSPCLGQCDRAPAALLGSRLLRQPAGARVDVGEHRGCAGGDRRSGPGATPLGGLAAGRVQGASSDATDRSRRPRELG